MPQPRQTATVYGADKSARTINLTPGRGLNSMFDSKVAVPPVDRAPAAPVPENPRPIESVVLPRREQSDAPRSVGQPAGMSHTDTGNRSREVFLDLPTGAAIEHYAHVSASDGYLIFGNYAESNARGMFLYRGPRPASDFPQVGVRVKGVQKVYLVGPLPAPGPGSISYQHGGVEYCLVPIIREASDQEFLKSRGIEEHRNGEASRHRPELDPAGEPGPDQHPAHNGQVIEPTEEHSWPEVGIDFDQEQLERQAPEDLGILDGLL